MHTSSGDSDSEKGADFGIQPKRTSNASSATYGSKWSLQTLRHAARSLSLFHTKDPLVDVERQSGCDHDADDVSVFRPSDKDGTKVRKREFSNPNRDRISLMCIQCSRRMPTRLSAPVCFQGERAEFHDVQRL